MAYGDEEILEELRSQLRIVRSVQSEVADAFAEGQWQVYDKLRAKGFTVPQAMEIIVAFVGSGESLVKAG